MPSIRSPSVTIAYTRKPASDPYTASRCLAAMAMPMALAVPWPSGPVVTSTPGVCPYSGWPGVRLPLPEPLELLQRRS